MGKVIIFAENFDGKFKKATFEAVSYGTEIAGKMGGEAVALSIGEVADDELKLLGNYGASKVLSVKNDQLKALDSRTFTDAIAQVAEKENASVLVFTGSNASKAIAPRVAARLKAGMVFAANGLPVSLEPFTVPKKVFHGKSFANVVIKTPVKVISLAQNSFGIVENVKDVAIEPMEVQVDPAVINTKVINVEKSTGKVLLNDAEVIVSGGRGMKNPDNWKPLEEIAATLDAALACSRPVSDEGWRPHSEHVGQTGKIVAPNLYFAFGISGAIQHLAGVSSSKVIVAVNTDKDAPIFQAADYGIIGDVKEVLPKLNEALKKFKAEN